MKTWEPTPRERERYEFDRRLAEARRAAEPPKDPKREDNMDRLDELPEVREDAHAR